MSIIIAFPKTRGRILTGICNVLTGAGFEDVLPVTSGSEALQEMNLRQDGILISCVQLPDLYYRELLFCMPSSFRPLLLDSEQVISALREEDVVALTLPLHGYELLNTVRMLEQSLVRAAVRQAPPPSKSRSGKDQREIDDAKALLMERNRMTEEEAYRYLQKTSMDTGSTMAETARMLLLFA